MFVVNITSELSPWLIVVEDNTVIIINCPMNVNISLLLEQNYSNKHKLCQLSIFPVRSNPTQNTISIIIIIRSTYDMACLY